jgi:hypothetical protein
VEVVSYGNLNFCLYDAIRDRETFNLMQCNWKMYLREEKTIVHIAPEILAEDGVECVLTSRVDKVEKSRRQVIRRILEDIEEVDGKEFNSANKHHLWCCCW